ncbi:hypothetical protein HID58_030651 [Brassica napus]|uniref:Uncharacterized protein n=1 Tax=Brassica napus TaxID=3708 RepID=A0ABQ8CGL5_BRANA|nr:hypothetical protein HID58_030651 [Brassica napus]
MHAASVTVAVAVAGRLRTLIPTRGEGVKAEIMVFKTMVLTSFLSTGITLAVSLVTFLPAEDFEARHAKVI